MRVAIGVDIGGTKIAVGLIEEGGICRHRLQLPSLADDREAMFEQVVRAIQITMDQSGYTIDELEGIGIGVPGKVDVFRGVALYQNNLPWRNFPLTDRIKEQFPVKRVVIDNDVYMAALAEWAIRGADAEETFVYLTISTGLSCSIIHKQTFLRGAGFAGEIGFLPVGVSSETGEALTLEKAAAGPAIERRGAALTTDKLSTKEWLEAYNNQDPLAAKLVDEVADDIAKGVYAVVCLLDPNKLVLGGGVVQSNPLFYDAIKRSLNKYLIPEQTDMLKRMAVSHLKETAGIVGAGLRLFHTVK
ncbi:ROK family protein [Camelliibacillus cellulosilyticus]|uniref:ROK family protein n=1 Tax=Camelliibacillus cellulosilyticus TaxID=2174486 RepID=A0ABV9GRD8_9BACL